MINSLVLLYALFLNNFGLSIIGFTIIIRIAMVPLTLKQSRQMKALTALQPKLKEIQTKYSDNKQKVSQETMKLYKENKVNPLGCLGPMIIQMPIFFGLFWSLRATLPSTPERLADLGGSLYSWLPLVHEVVPLNSAFLWMDLAQYASQDSIPILLPVLVGGSMWLMQKMTPVASTTPQQQQTQLIMQWMMPIMFGVFTLSFEMGLALYWIVSNLVGIIIQGFVTGWEPIYKLFNKGGAGTHTPTTTIEATEEAESDGRNDGADGADGAEADNHDDSKDSRRGNRTSSKGTRRRSRGGRSNRR
jgi:YidC/Oxa1 family membrane protein insertase|tara:strand:- start:269 stop:1177 length:909 start_codon:yes stop_codon:yes gene_type:complete